jgi:hypothetical protein
MMQFTVQFWCISTKLRVSAERKKAARNPLSPLNIEITSGSFKNE